MRRFLLSLALFLFAAFARMAQAQCATNVHDDGTPEPTPYRGETYVYMVPTADSIPLPADLQRQLTEVNGKSWGRQCPTGTNPHIPTYSFVPTMPLGGARMDVLFRDMQPPPDQGGFQVAAFATPPPGQAGTPTMLLYDQCPTAWVQAGSPLCLANGHVDWNNPYLTIVLAHELGHANGLGHDIESTDCSKQPRGLMAGTDPSAFMRNGEYCKVADAQNCDGANGGQCGGPYAVTGTLSGLSPGETVSLEVTGTLFGVQYSSSMWGTYWRTALASQPVFPAGTSVQIHLTNISNLNKQCTISPSLFTMGDSNFNGVTVSCTCGNPSSGLTSNAETCPDADDNLDDPTKPFIDERPPICEFCFDDDVPWWETLPGPTDPNGKCETVCHPGPFICDEIKDEHGNVIGYTNCRETDVCDATCHDGSSLTLSGPSITFHNPASGAVVNGRMYVSGFANDEQGLKNLFFFVDYQPVALEELQTHAYAPEACAQSNRPTPCDPNVGFSGWLNVDQFGAGTHHLDLLVSDADPRYPMPTVWGLPFVVGASCGDATPPAALVNAPTAGATVSGVVAVTAWASDDQRVAKVELYVDDVLKGTDSVAPYSFAWDSRTIANGAHVIRVRAYDGCNNSTPSEGVAVTVQNDAQHNPNARNDAASTPVNAGVTISVLANDTDADGDALTLSRITQQPQHGTAALAAPAVRYTPATSFSGQDSFEYEVRDATGRTDRARVTITVAGVNSKPDAVDDAATVHGTATITIDVTANDSDPDGDAVRLIQSPVTTLPTRGYATRLSNSQINYTPYAAVTATDTFEYEIADGRGRHDRAWVTVTLVDANRAPTAVNDSATTSSNVPVTIDVTANDTDPDGDQVLLIANPITTPPTSGVAQKVSGTSISYTPNNGFAGTDTFVYEIGDGFGRRSRATVTVTVSSPNRAPEAVDDVATTTPNTAVTINVIANDSDPDGDRVTLITSPVVSAPSNGTALKVSGTSITYTPRAGYTGTDRFQYEAGDGRGARSRAWVDVTISSGTPEDRNPIAADDAATTHVNQAVTINVTANDSDPDGDTVTLITSPVIIAPAHGTAVKTTGSSITYTPLTGFAGSDTFEYEVGDGRGKRARAWVAVTVVDVNSRPVAHDDLVLVTAGGTATINVTANDTDPDGDTVTLIGSPIITPPGSGTATKVNGSTFTYKPNANAIGTDRFQYEVGDGHGARSRAWVNINIVTITPLRTITNTPPLAANDAVIVAAGTSVDIDPLSNDLDPDNDPVILSEAAITVQPRVGTVGRTSDRTLTYYAHPGFTGTDGFEYEISDDRGGTSRAWVTLTIPVPNSAPRPVPDVATVAVNRSAIIRVVANDTDPDGDALRLTERLVSSPPAYGSVRRESDTELAYTPQLGYVGPDVFEYEVTDDHGHSATARVALEVIDNSVPPVAVGDAMSAESGVATRIDVAANDRDPDGDAFSVVSSQQPAHGSVTWDPGTATASYVSDAGYAGADSFSYTIADTHGLESSATVSVTVTPVRHAPVLQNDTATTKTRTAVLIGVLANDYDPDWNRLTVKSVTQPSGGTVVINNGFESITFTPSNTFAGTATFNYTAADGTGMESTASVTVTVTNQAPLPHTDTLAASEDLAIGYQAWNVLSNDTDPDGDELHIVSVEQPATGRFAVAADNSQFTYFPKANWSGVDSFYYTVADPFGAQVRVFAQISVSAVNDAPVVVNDSFSTYKNQLLRIAPSQVLANDSDIEGNTLSVYSVGAATNGTAARLADGTIEYTPYGEYVGSDSFDYTVADGAGAYTTGRITVNVLQDTKPVPNFTATCTGRTCVFDASSSTDDRGIVSYAWKLGNNQNAAGKTFTYTYPVAGGYSVVLTVTDAIGQTANVVKYVAVTEPPPDARDDAFAWKKGYPREILYSSMLANDTDPNNDTLTITSFDTSLTDGTLSCSNSSCVFTPPSSLWWGQTTFKYTISDGHGQSDTATVTITFNY